MNTLTYHYAFQGELRHIHKLRHWKLADVLHDKYGLSRADADFMSSFLLPMLDLNPDKRASARQSLNNPWLQTDSHLPEGTTPNSGTVIKSVRSRSPVINGTISKKETSGDKNVKQENKKNEILERRHSSYYKSSTKANDVKVDPSWKY